MKLKYLSMAVVALSLCTGLTSIAEDAKPAAEKPKAEKMDKKPAKLGGVLDQLDLTDAQKAEITKIRTESKVEIAKAEEALKKLKDDAKAKELAVLTPEQQAKAKSIEDEAKKAKEDAKKAADAAKGAATQEKKDK